MTTFIRLGVLVPFCLLSLACASAKIERPTAAVRGMALGPVTAQGFTMNFDVDVANPNAFEVPLSDADYGLTLAGVKVLDGKASPTGSLPANGSKAVTVPVAVTFDALLKAEQALVKSGGNVPYALDGGLSVGGGAKWLGQSVRVPVSYSGTLPLRDVLKDPKVLMENPAARALAQKVLGRAFGF